MGAQNTSGYITLLAAAAVGQNIRVVIDSNGKAAIATAAQRGIGTTQNMASAADGLVNVRLFTHPGTFLMKAAGDFVARSVVYAAADGEVDNVATAVKMGVALEAATADGDQIEVMPIAEPTVAASHTVIAAGIHTWGGGAAATDAITPGVAIAATDIVHVTINVRGAGNPTTVISVGIDDANDEIDVLLDQNGTDASTTLFYSVLRAIA